MAYLRLQTPIGVQEDARKRYEEQLHQEAEVLALHYIDRKQLEPLHYLCEHRYLTGNALEHATQKALEDQWSEELPGLWNGIISTGVTGVGTLRILKGIRKL